MTALFVVLGPAIGTLVFGHGRTTVGEARQIGVVLALSAFGLVPLAITMLQLRVFYAIKDARTPTLVNVGMVAVKVLACLGAAAVLPDRYLVAGLAVATGLSYVAGTVAGEVLLRRRFGALDTGRVLRASAGFLLLSAVAALAAWGVLALVTGWLGAGTLGSAVAVVLGSLVGTGGAGRLHAGVALDRAGRRAARAGRAAGSHRRRGRRPAPRGGTGGRPPGRGDLTGTLRSITSR